MKTKNVLAAVGILSSLLVTTISQAQPSYWAPIRSGNWSDTNSATSPWANGVTNILAPGTNTFIEVMDGIVIIVDVTNAVCEALDSTQGTIENGTVTMAPGSTITVFGKNEGYGTQSLGYLIATATNCTVVYRGNAFWAQRTDYYNLVFGGWGDFYNGAQNGYPITPMTVYGNMIVNGTNVPSDQPGYTGVYVELGGDFTVMGNFSLATSNAWDCSLSDFVVMGNTFCAGFLWDQDTANGSNYFAGNFIVPPSSMAITNINNTLLQKYNSDNPSAPVTVIYGGLDLQTGTNWDMGANLTNNGLIQGQGYGSINFNGTGTIAGSNAITIPTMVVNGTYEIGTTITLTTNTPIFNGTLVFDIAKTNQIILQAGAGTALYYNGNLNVINSGASTASGTSYTFFTCPNGFGGGFASETFPNLPNGLSWVDNLLTSGSIAITGTLLGAPSLTLSRSGGSLTLSWDSTTFPGYSVQGQTNHAGIGSNWSSTGSGTVSPYTVTINPANPPVFFRLSNP
jgi:hypothetical protein